jgi:hypothetical protein
VIVIVPIKQVDPVQLKAELIAAGVPPWSEPLAEPQYAGSGRMAVFVPGNADADLIARVVQNHTDRRTPAEALAVRLQGLMAGRDPLLRLIRSALGEIYDSLVDTRAELQETRAELRRVTQQLIDAGLPVSTGITVNPQPNREWGQALQAVLQRAVQEGV